MKRSRSRHFRHGVIASLAAGLMVLAGPAEAALFKHNFSVLLPDTGINLQPNPLGVTQIDTNPPPDTDPQGSQTFYGFAIIDDQAPLGFFGDLGWRASNQYMQFTIGNTTFANNSVTVVLDDLFRLAGFLAPINESTPLTQATVPGGTVVRMYSTDPQVLDLFGTIIRTTSAFSYSNGANKFVETQGLVPGTVEAVPLPGALPLLASALLLGGAVVRRRKAAA